LSLNQSNNPVFFPADEETEDETDRSGFKGRSAMSRRVLNGNGSGSNTRAESPFFDKQKSPEKSRIRKVSKRQWIVFFVYKQI